MTAKLANQTQKTAGIPNGMRTATVVAITGGKVTISLSGGTFSSGVGVISSYAPRIGDIVAVFRQDASWTILGSLTAANGWQRMSALGYQNGWVDRGTGFPIGQWRIAGSEVQLVGQITIASAPTSPSTIVTGMPAPGGEVVMIGVIGSVRGRLSIDQTGTLRIYDGTAAGTLQFCSTYPLDCIIA